MTSQATLVLDAAAAELAGPLVRTSASVIGIRAGESVIVATTSWGYTVTVLLKSMRILMSVRPRGWLRRCLAVEGAPLDLVNRIVEPFRDRLRAARPLLVELTPMALRFEQKYGPPPAVAAAIDLASGLARRALEIDGAADANRLAG
jgi:hypothetical protein